MTHSTGHLNRLARDTITEAAPSGSATYSKEELRMEMGAANLYAETGISPAVIANQASYVAGWLKKLRDDRKLLIHPAAWATCGRVYFERSTRHLKPSGRPRVTRAPHFSRLRHIILMDKSHRVASDMTL